MAQLITGLAARHRVGLVYLRGPGDPPAGSVVQSCERVVEITRPWSAGLGRWTRGVRLLTRLLLGTPLWAARWAVPGVGSQLRRLVAEWRPDVVQFEYHVMGQYARSLKSLGVPRVLVQHDPGTPAALERVRAAHGVERFWASLDRRAWERYERRVSDDVERIVVFTARDRAAVVSLAGVTPVVRIPLGTDIPARAADPRGEGRLVLFVGNFKHHPNVDAAERLVSRIFPRIRARCPEATLAIVGGHAPGTLRSSESVSVVGLVPDLRPWLERAAVVVAPLSLGGGMRVKVLEGLAAGKAMVCSTLAAEGLDVTDGQHLLVADSDADFADAVAELLENPERRERLGRAARDWATAHAGWDRSAAAYERLYQEMLGRGGLPTLPVGNES